MASFDTYYVKLKPIESGYANDPDDLGKETYCGISRVHNPNWAGWPFVDRAKLKKGQILPELETLVKTFYKQRFWTPVFASLINSQSIAEIIVDWKINGGLNIEQIQNFVGANPDGKLGTDTITAINSVDQKTLFENIKKARKKHYDAIVAAKPEQKKFLKGWYNRLEKFQYIPLASLGISTLLIGAWIIYLILDSKKTLI